MYFEGITMTTIVTNGQIVLVDRLFSVAGAIENNIKGFDKKFRRIRNGKQMRKHHRLGFEPTLGFFTGAVGRANEYINFLEGLHQNFDIASMMTYGNNDDDFTVILTGDCGEATLFQADRVIDIGESLLKRPKVFGSGALFYNENKKLAIEYQTEEDLVDFFFLMSVYFDEDSSYDFNKVTLDLEPKIEYVQPSEERIKQAFGRYFNPIFYRPRLKVREATIG